jgi:hypothetical protein
MPPRRIAWLLALSVLAGACGSGSPSIAPGPGGSGDQITDSDRLGWNQAAADSAELATFRYVAYVDGTRVELTNVSCGGAPTSGSFACNSRFPTMSPGAHTLELAAFVVDDGSIIEGPRSSPLRVTVVGSTAGAAPTGAGQPTSEMTTADGVRLRP